MPDLGKKFDCYNCHTKFYNLGKPEAICPKCGANQKNAKLEEATVAAPRPPRRNILLENIPDETQGEFGEEGPAEPEEPREPAEEGELSEEGEPREPREEEEEEY